MRQFIYFSFLILSIFAFAAFTVIILFEDKSQFTNVKACIALFESTAFFFTAYMINKKNTVKN